MLKTAAARAGEFTASAQRRVDELVLSLRGMLGVESEAAFRALLAETHEELVRLKLTHIVLDFSELEFINSTCIKHLVSWLHSVEGMGSGRYSITMRARRERRGMLRTLEILHGMAPTFTKVDAPTAT